MSLPRPLARYGADLERAARRRAEARARRGRRLRAAVATVAALGATTGLAAAGGIVPLPFDDAPRAVVYTVSSTAPDGTAQTATCRASDAGDGVAGDGVRCAADGPVLPLHRLAVELQRRGTARATVALTRLCRRPGGCRTVTGAALATPARAELVSESLAGLRPAPQARGPVTAFALGAAPVRGGVRYGVVGGRYAGRTYACDGADARAALCRLRRGAMAHGLLDVDAVLRAAGARAWITEMGRRCPLTGDRPCVGIDPSGARRLAADPSALRPGEAATYERQLTGPGFGTTP